MAEKLRTCFHILVVPIWRRRYFVVSAGLIWVVLYICVHYANGPNHNIGDALGNGAGVSLTTGSMSAKLPVDMAFVMPEESKRIVDNRQNYHAPKEIVSKAPFAGRKTFKKQVIASPLANNEFNADFAYSKDTIEKVNDLHSTLEGNSNSIKNNIPPEVNKNKSPDERYFTDEIKPVITNENVQPTRNQTNDAFQEPPFIPPFRLVHFDLKGAPPKVSYLTSILSLAKNAGANGIIMEYEDMFPFWGSLSSIPAGNAYKRRDIKHILETAKSLDLHVIPLIQTFGHLEFVLKLPEYKHLREVEESPQALCPTNNGSLQLVKTMIDQILALHTDCKWLHIGSDEVFHLGHCKRCSRYDRNSLFLAYVRKVASHVRNVHKIIPIIWDDMLRHVTVPELQKYEMGKLVEPMAWSYVEDVYLFIPDSLWLKYSQVFPYMWTASAFKGAFGETLTVPDAKRHLENNKSWLQVLREQSKLFKSFRGIALTGWQRYDHFSSLCELLPAAVPSLVLNMLTVSQGKFDDTIFPKMQEALDCSSRKHYHLDLEHDPYLWRALGVCFFQGSSVFRLTLRHNDVTKSIDKFIYDTTVHKGWLTEYNANHNFTSPTRVNELLREFSYHNSSLQMLLEAAVKSLKEVFDDYTVNEWIELNIYPSIKKMAKLWDMGVFLKKFDVWPRRPFPKVVKLPPPSMDLGFIKS